MTGLELSHAYYNEFGKPMLESDFPDILKYLAVGFVGSGSDRYGFDDEISRDHDFEPGFCIFLPGEDIIDRRTEFLLERAYYKLPKEFMGIKRQVLSPVGGNRNGVIRTDNFYLAGVGAPDGILTVSQWLQIPDSALADITNGKVFYDGLGEFTAIRERLLHFPGDIRLKKLAGNLLLMAQSGQYNFVRCLKHNEPEAAQLACMEFVNAAMKAYFLINDKYMPYYKWSFRALRNLGGGDMLADDLKILISGDNSDCSTAENKYETIEEIAAIIISEVQHLGITKATCGDLEKHAYSVNDFISDVQLRNMNILAAVKDI